MTEVEALLALRPRAVTVDDNVNSERPPSPPSPLHHVSTSTSVDDIASLEAEVRELRAKTHVLEEQTHIAQAESASLRTAIRSFRTCVNCQSPVHSGIFAACGHFVCCQPCAADFINHQPGSKNSWAVCAHCSHRVCDLLMPPPPMPIGDPYYHHQKPLLPMPPGGAPASYVST